MANVVPQGSVVLGVIVYVAGMVLFTMVMGNAFAAFSVITVGIGVPFVILQSGDPAIVGALGMTARFLRHPDDTDGGEFQYRAGGGARNEKQIHGDQGAAADGAGHDRRSCRADACIGFLSLIN